MKMAVAGTGSIGQRHISNLRQMRPDCQFIFLRADGRKDELAQKLSAKVVSTFEEALSCSPDAMILANPSSLRADLILQAISADLPIYIEKPVVTKLEDIEAIRKQLSKHEYNSPTLVGCNLRFLPSLQRLHWLLKNDVIGKIVRAVFEAGQWLPDWRPKQDYRMSYSADTSRGGGVVMDLMHEIDAARWLLGDMVDVRAFLADTNILEINSESVVTAIMRSNEGALISLALDYIARQPLRRYQLVGEHGTLTWDLSTRSLTLDTTVGRDAMECGERGFDIADTYRAAMTEFLNALEEQRKTSLPLEEGLNSTELAIRIKEQSC